MDQGQPVASPPTGSSAAAVPAGGAVLPGRRGFNPSNYLTVLLFVGPALILIGLLVVYPAIKTIINAFYTTVGIGYNAPTSFTGWTNFSNMFTDPNMQTAIKNNILWLVVVTPVTVVLGVVFAVLFDRVRYEGVAKSIVFIPMAISATASGVIWVLMYADDPNVGTINAVLGWFHAGPISFLGDTSFVNW